MNLKVKLSDVRFVREVFPEYTGRKISVETRKDVHIFRRNYWSGGVRSFWAAYNLATNEVCALPDCRNPILDATDPVAEIPDPNILICEHCYVGSSQWVVLHAHPDAMPKFLGAGQ